MKNKNFKLTGIFLACSIFAILVFVVFFLPFYTSFSFGAQADIKDINILYPQNGSLFPPDIIAPTIRIRDTHHKSNYWFIKINCPASGNVISHCSSKLFWKPSNSQWERIKKGSQNSQAIITVRGVNKFWPIQTLSFKQIVIRTSQDSVIAPIFYREVNLPFEDAVKDPSRIRWRFGQISKPTQPPVILTNLPVCANCHSFSKDGSVLGMDVDYANDKGAYAIATVAKNIVLDKKNIITWNDYEKNDSERTFGLLSQVSPDGRYVISTVKDVSVFVAKPDLEFSQLFFPIKGILAFYDTKEKKFQSLIGANDKQFVNSNPSWSPDGKTVVFIRSKAYDRKKSSKGALMLPQECNEFLSGKNKFLYDIYTVPFHEGKGGVATPLLGASQNGMSNYFPKVSPDGKWVVYCQAASFSLLQPDSKLYIIPFQGGNARLMHCNTSRMNSWHSWSPNGKWLVFSSKLNGCFTQLFLTHVDSCGEDTPPILLENFTSNDRAANIPEFVNTRGQAIDTIKEQFVDHYSYALSGANLERYSDIPAAIAAYKKSLNLNPRDPQIHYEVGKLSFLQGNLDEAERYLLQTIFLRPDFFVAYVTLGNLNAEKKRSVVALTYYNKAIALAPYNKELHFNMGLFYDELGNKSKAIEHYTKAITIDPAYADAHNNLGLDLEAQGNVLQARIHFEKALQCNPGLVAARENLGRLERRGK